MTFLKKITAFALVFLLFGKASFAQNIKLVNPILSGFYPDPSIWLTLLFPIFLGYLFGTVRI
jgi:hypothetical protein